MGNDYYKVRFECEYATTYTTDLTEADVQGNVIQGPTDGVGELSFSVQTYTDNTFSTEETSNSLTVGDTLYFGISIRESLDNVEFVTTDCTVYSSTDTSSSDTLDYAVL